MKAVNFEEQNGELGNGLPGYYNVPMYKAENANGDVIMKIEVTPEEWEKVKENGFCFWYTRQTGEAGLQPFSMDVNKPFVQIFQLNEISAGSIEEFVQAGTTFRNEHVGRDVDIVEIITVIEGRVSYKLLNAYGSTEETKMASFGAFAEFLLASEHSDKWFIVNPKS